MTVSKHLNNLATLGKIRILLTFKKDQLFDGKVGDSPHQSFTRNDLFYLNFV